MVRRRRQHRKMNKQELCKIRVIRFKTKRGRTVVINGRVGGSELCGKRRPSASQQASRRVFRKVASKCNHIRSVKARGVCFTQSLKYGLDAKFRRKAA